VAPEEGVEVKKKYVENLMKTIASSSFLKNNLQELQIFDAEVSEDIIDKAMSVYGVSTTLHVEEKLNKSLQDFEKLAK